LGPDLDDCCPTRIGPESSDTLVTAASCAEFDSSSAEGQEWSTYPLLVRYAASVVSRLLAATIVGALSLLVQANPVVAECMDGRPTTDASDYRAFVFSAVVTATSTDPTQAPPEGDSPYDFEATLDVGRVFRGTLPDRLVVNGWSAGCSQLLVPALNSGDVLLIAFGGTDPRTCWGRCQTPRR
jgi:hypothetical protein